MIRYLGQESFGIWLALLSIMSWVVFFYRGLGNWLRNKFTELLAKADSRQAAAYTSSAYTPVNSVDECVDMLLGFLVPFLREEHTCAGTGA